MGGFDASVREFWRFAVPFTLEGTQPSAGASYSVSLDGAWWWELDSCVFTLTTDSNVASRYVTVEYVRSDTIPVLIGAAAVTVSASTTNQRFAGDAHRATSEWNTGTDVLFPLSPRPLAGGGTLKVNIASVQVGDQLTKLRFVFWRLPTRESIVEQFLGYPANEVLAPFAGGLRRLPTLQGESGA